jgi:poly(hydroxyalkanoate) granule-associated protein
MSESSRTIVERWLAAVVAGDTTAAVDAAEPGIELHGLGAPVRGRASVEFVLASIRAASPDLRLDAEVLAADGNAVVVARFAAKGTLQIDLFGLKAGQPREVTGVACFTVGEAGIASVSLYVDGGQLAALFATKPAPAAAAGAAPAASAVAWLDQFRGGAREIWLAGMGALVAAGEQGERLFHDLAERGRTLEGSGRARVADTVNDIDKKKRELGERARSVVSSGQEFVRDVASDFRTRLDLPSRAEFVELTQRVDRLAAQLDSTPVPPMPPTNGTAQPTAESTS